MLIHEKLGNYLVSDTGLVRKFTVPGADIDSFIDSVVVLSGDRLEVEPDQIPAYFQPVTGKRKIKGMGLVLQDCGFRMATNIGF